MTTEAAVKEITLKPETETFAGQVKDAIKIEHKKGDATAFAIIDPVFYASTLPEGITVKMIEDLQTHNALFAAGAARALSLTAAPFVKKHGDVTRVQFDIPTVKKDGFELTYDRQRTVPSRNEDGSMGSALQYGAIRVSHRAYAAESVGELKKVKQLSVADAAKLYGE